MINKKIFILIILLIILYKIIEKKDTFKNTKKNLCVVFICNKAYFHKFEKTCEQLMTNGKYKGDICLIIGDDLLNDKILDCDLINKNNIIIKHFPDIKFPDKFYKINDNVNSDGRNKTKKFQWHKLYLFDKFFKKWNYIFYIDCGMRIFSDIKPLLNEVKKNTFLAHSDAFPKYEWKLSGQFDKNISEYFTKLNKKYNLDIDYFQTTMMIYDTNLIKNNTFDELFNLSVEYPISTTNEQGIMNLYFTNIKPAWKQIKTKDKNQYYYDFTSRKQFNKYIMLKY